MKILNCNIRTSGADDGDDNWRFRKDNCIEVIGAQAADIICFQEMTAEQFADLSSGLESYDWYAMSDAPQRQDPNNCIFYKADAFRRVSSGGYWLSETPHISGSASWDSSYPRLANWLRLIDRETGREFRIVNTHLDHISQPAREEQARVIVEDSAAYADDYVQILCGDMNCDSSNAAIQGLKDGGWIDSYGALHGTEDPGPTYHAFMGPEHNDGIGKMDWVFIRGNIRATEAEIITESRDGHYPSDHYFVSATLA